MPAVGKVTLDAKEYEATLEKIKQKTAVAAQNMSQSASTAGGAASTAGKAAAKNAAKVGSEVSAAGGALSAFGAAAGTHMGAAGQAISALAAGPVAALVGALGALLAVGIAIWDRLTLSAEEYAEKVSRAAERADKERQALLKQQGEDSGYMARLQELAKREKLTNDQRIEAANLIRVLTSRYGELGISIDKVTGALINADGAQKRMLERQREQRIQTVRRQMFSNDRKAFTQAQMAITNMMPGEAFLNKIGFGFKSIDEAKDKVGEVMTYHSLKDRLEMAERLRDASKTKEDMDNWQGVVDAIEKQIELQNELKMLRESGDLNESERAARLKGHSDASQQTAEKASVSNNYYTDQINMLMEQVKIQSLLAQGMDEAAQKQQILNELKRKGLSYDSASVDKILELNQKLGAVKLQNAQKKEAESLYGRALRVMGMNRQADERSALQKAREQKGSELTDAEKASTLKLLHLTSQLEELGSARRMDFAVQTNALTARGGFQLETKTDDNIARHNNMMMNLEKSQLRVVEEIRGALNSILEE